MIEVLRPGLLTTVQDLGRADHRAEGVSSGGALDPVALRVANLLVGNPQGAAGLEITLAGPRLHFTRDALVALAGATLDARVEGDAVRALRPVQLRAGETLELGSAARGCRAYLAIAGGVAVPAVLGSRATDLRGRFGGMHGRALRAGDRMAVAGSPRPPLDRREADWGLHPSVLPARTDPAELRVVAGTHPLTRTSRGALLTATFRLGRDSDRTGCRLEGPPLELAHPLELTSEGVAPGTVQLPPGGAPIILLADGGTTGGYPRIAHVATVDLPLLAQLRPGDSLRFRAIALAEAHRLLAGRERELALLASLVRLRRG